MASVLVTGGAGFIGSHLVDRLLDRGETVVVLDDLSSGRRDNLPQAHPRLTFIEESVLQAGQLADRLASVKCVFHLAARISAFESLGEPEPYFETNVTGLLRLFTLVKRLDRPRLVFASTSGVYGNGSAKIRRETDLPTPATVYALTKLSAEHLLEMYRERIGYDDVSFRLFNVYGPRQKPDHPYANVTCKFCWAVATGHPVILYGDGGQSRDFVYVDDVVGVLIAAMDRPTPRRIYNVGTGMDASIGTLLELVQSLSGRRLVVDRQPPWANDIRAIAADVGRLKEDLGLSPEVSLSEGLARTIEYFRT